VLIDTSRTLRLLWKLNFHLLSTPHFQLGLCISTLIH
jgi:hypothetical protein